MVPGHTDNLNHDINQRASDCNPIMKSPDEFLDSMSAAEISERWQVYGTKQRATGIRLCENQAETHTYNQNITKHQTNLHSSKGSSKHVSDLTIPDIDHLCAGDGDYAYGNMRRTVILNSNANNTSIESYNNRILESNPNITYLNKSQEEMHAINLNRNMQHNEQHDVLSLKGSKCHVYGLNRPDNVFIGAGDGDWTYDNLRMTGFTNSIAKNTSIETFINMISDTAPDSNILTKSQAETQANTLIKRAGENDRNIDEEMRQLSAFTSSSDEITMLYDNRSYNPDPMAPEYSKIHSEPDTVKENSCKPTTVIDFRELLNGEERVRDGIDCRRIFDPG